MPSKIALILRKEWIEIRQQRSLLLGMILPPIFFSILPLGMVFTFGLLPPDSDTDDMVSAISQVNPAYIGMRASEAAQALIAGQMSLLFLLLPTILTSIIASYSIVGEKNNRTLEPILATPVTTQELLVGKSLTALIPAVLATWLAAGIFAAGMAAIALGPSVFSAVISSGWLISVLLASPMLGLITIALTVMVSSRASDPRSAQQISVLTIIPVMVFFFGQITGFLVLSPFVALAAVAVLALTAAFTIWLAARVFQREKILTRWT